MTNKIVTMDLSEKLDGPDLLNKYALIRGRQMHMLHYAYERQWISENELNKGLLALHTLVQ
jgi:hypothetical protein